MDYRIFNLHTDVNACDCTLGIWTPKEYTLKVTLGRKSLVTPGRWTCVSGMMVRCSTNWATSPPVLQFQSLVSILLLLAVWIHAHTVWFCFFVSVFCCTSLWCFVTTFPSKLSHELWWDQCAVCRLYAAVNRQDVTSHKITSQICFSRSHHNTAFI